MMQFLKKTGFFFKMVKTKIICTIGPASRNETSLRNMAFAGMDIARLNFSHGTHTEHSLAINLIRKLNKKYRRHIRILQDLEGYRIRIGKFKTKSPVELKKKKIVYLTSKITLGDKNTIPFDYKGSLSGIKKGSDIFIDDGNIALRVMGVSGRALKTEVVVPGILKENKGINIPGVNLPFKGITEKDKLDLEFGIKLKVDYVAQSFVRDEFDVIPLRNLLKKRLPLAKIISKIENRQGIKNIKDIIRLSDGIMIARGDMGVSIPIYEIPMVQKKIIKMCNHAKKFVITATQMLESMVLNLRPTRAEVTDVANAILDGTDYVMLSAETAAGKYPVQAVKLMNDIIKFTEKERLNTGVCL